MKSKIKIINIFLLLVLFVTVINFNSVSIFADGKSEHTVQNYNFEDNSLIVSMQNNYANYDFIGNLFDEFGIIDIEELSASLNTNIFKIRFSFHDREKLFEIIKSYSDVKEIKYLEPDFYGEFASNEESFYDMQWGLYGDNGINAADAWTVTLGSYSVRVGVIDTGVYRHKDIAENLSTGWNFVDDNNKTEDTFGHGTQIAGIIGAKGGGQYAMSGVSKRVQIVPLKISNNIYWSTSNVVKAINYAEELYDTNYQIDILNLSGRWKGTSKSLYDAVNSFSGLFICAAGNDSKDIDVEPVIPASYDFSNIITVGSIDQNAEKSSFSNYGKMAVDLFAPGGSIYSTRPNDNYLEDSGTSFAAPHVAGVAALIYAKCPDITASAVKSFILNSVDKVSNLKDLCVTGGKLNAYEAVKRAHTTQHTEAYHFSDKNEHEVYCDYCNHFIRMEQHHWQPRTSKAKVAVLPESWICKDCRCILYRNGDIAIVYKEENEYA